MENNITVKVTEEVIRQTVEVKFKQTKYWEISFTNPTAGPWKVITIGDYEGGHDLRYDKEEDRPDLILFDHKSGTFLIFEAKDEISKMFSKNQIRKSVDVFTKEIDKITKIIESKDNKRKIINNSEGRYQFYVGYIYSKIEKSDTYISKKREELITEHKDKIPKREENIEPTIHIIVDEEGDRLVPRHKLFGFKPEEVSLLQDRLPTGGVSQAL